MRAYSATTEYLIHYLILMARFPKDKASRKKRHQTPAAADLPASEGGREPGPSVEPTSQSTHQQTVIPVLCEELTVDKREVETGKGVRITKSVSEREEIVDEPLTKDEVVVERVAINKIVDDSDIPSIHYEGETMVVPILEEVLVTEKRTRIKEEVRITRQRREFRDPQRFVLRTEQVSAEHFNDPGNLNDPKGSSNERD
jgi:uncharacterized protein (TIGR02271 family)